MNYRKHLAGIRNFFEHLFQGLQTHHYYRQVIHEKFLHSNLDQLRISRSHRMHSLSVPARSMSNLKEQILHVGMILLVQSAHDFLIKIRAHLAKKCRGKSCIVIYSWRMTFQKADRKMSMRRVPNEVFGVSEFLDRKFVKIIFRGRGPQISTILSFFRNGWSKFL